MRAARRPAAVEFSALQSDLCVCATAVNLVMQVVSRGLDAQKDFTRLVEATRMLPRIWLPRRCRRRRRRR